MSDDVMRCLLIGGAYFIILAGFVVAFYGIISYQIAIRSYRKSQKEKGLEPRV